MHLGSHRWLTLVEEGWGSNWNSYRRKVRSAASPANGSSSVMLAASEEHVVRHVQWTDHEAVGFGRVSESALGAICE